MIEIASFSFKSNKSKARRNECRSNSEGIQKAPAIQLHQHCWHFLTFSSENYKTTQNGFFGFFSVEHSGQKDEQPRVTPFPDFHQSHSHKKRNDPDSQWLWRAPRIEQSTQEPWWVCSFCLWEKHPQWKHRAAAHEEQKNSSKHSF